MTKGSLVIHKIKGDHRYINGKCLICGRGLTKESRFIFDAGKKILYVPDDKATFKDISEECYEIYARYNKSPAVLRMSPRAIRDLKNETTTGDRYISQPPMGGYEVMQFANVATGEIMRVEMQR